MTVGSLYETKRSRVHYVVVSVDGDVCKIKALDGRKHELSAPTQYLNEYFIYRGKLS